MSEPPSIAPGLTCIGALLIDDIAKPLQMLHQGASNPVQWRHRLGGVACNVASAASTQCAVTQISAIGNDIDSLLADPRLKRVDQRWINIDQANDRYTAVLTPEGDLFIGLSSAVLTESLRVPDIQAYLPEQSAAYAIDANLHPECLTQLVEFLAASEYKPIIAALPVSPQKATKWLNCAQHVDVLFCNRREAAALTGLPTTSSGNKLATSLRSIGFNNLILTDASNPIIVMQNDVEHYINVPECTITGNVNGAGDALAGATLSHYLLTQNLMSSVANAGIRAAGCIIAGETVAYPAP